MKYALVLIGAALVWTNTGQLRAATSGEEVLVIYNKNLEESKNLAEYYAQRRRVPKDHLLGLNLPASESINRDDFEDRLAKPLLKTLRDRNFFVYRSGRRRSSETNEVPIQAKIRYALLCYGVPLKITNDPKFKEDGVDKIRTELRRNDAAVDSELSVLPILSPKPPIFGAVQNRVYGVTNSSYLHPTNGLLMVARLDGPSAEIARGLIDKAIQAEVEGLWGRAYFDARGLTNTSYQLGDNWIRAGAEVARRLGFETVLDREPATFATSFPLSHIALYAGWYDGGVSGPFTREQVEFMPGAFAYHLQSYSAHTIRSATANWVGPLLAKGATVTLGCVEEPYLEGTPDIMTFLVRLLYSGFTFGEAAYACQSSLSWQTTVVGDPLYRPMARQALELHQELLRKPSSLVEWSHLKVVNMNMANGIPTDQLIQYLEERAETRTSAVLLEKLGDLNVLKARWDQAVIDYRRALDQSPSPQQRVRLVLALGRTFEFMGKAQDAFGVYQQFVKATPEYPDLLGIYRKLVPLAQQLGKTEELEQIQKEIQRLTPAPAAAPAAAPAKL